MFILLIILWIRIVYVDRSSVFFFLNILINNWFFHRNHARPHKQNNNPKRNHNDSYIPQIIDFSSARILVNLAMNNFWGEGFNIISTALFRNTEACKCMDFRLIVLDINKIVRIMRIVGLLTFLHLSRIIGSNPWVHDGR